MVAGVRVPCNARLSAPVAFCVKMIPSRSEIEKKRAAASRA